MAFIYKITNLINGKMYVGKTTKTIQQRFKEHCQDSKKERLSHRPLYSDMKEYGCENFSVELLEEDNSNPEQKEIYWIEKLNTKIPNGYNIALGGNGKKLITNQEKEKIVKLYKEGHSIQDIYKITNRTTDMIAIILKENNISIRETKEYTSKTIGQYDEDGNLIAIYKNIGLIEKELSGGNTHGHISACAKGKRKKAYGYYWKYIDN